MKKNLFIFIMFLLMVPSIVYADKYVKVENITELLEYDESGNLKDNNKFVVVSNDRMLFACGGGDSTSKYTVESSGKFSGGLCSSGATYLEPYNKGVIEGSAISEHNTLEFYTATYDADRKEIKAKLLMNKLSCYYSYYDDEEYCDDYDSFLALGTDSYLTSEEKNTKITEGTTEGTFVIRKDKNNYLSYVVGEGYDVRETPTEFFIYKRVDDNIEVSEINIYNYYGQLVDTDYVYGSYTIFDYINYDYLPDDVDFKGWSTTKDGKDVVYTSNQLVNLNNNIINLYPIFEVNNNIEYDYYYDDDIILASSAKDNFDETNVGKVNIYIHKDLDETSKIEFEYKYDKVPRLDLTIKFMDNYDVNKYKNRRNYIYSEDKADSKYIITRLYANQSFEDYSYIDEYDDEIILSTVGDKNEITELGGYIDNIVDGSDVHIYISQKYSIKYIDYKGEVLGAISEFNKYAISPDLQDNPEIYSDAIDPTVINDEYKDNDNFKYDVSQTVSLIQINKDDKWYINDIEISGEKELKDLLDYADDTEITLESKKTDGIFNPNTGLFLPIVEVLLLIGVLIVFNKITKKYKKSIYM